ncbi:MAG: hypothetical protein VKQ33_03610 [Candidatus Sericytochromatia bacterium]|nr:hypothetical protein [Candidatus Sericytochromatia bacterium]
MSEALSSLKEALEVAPSQQIALLQAVDVLWAAVEDAGEALSSEQALEAQLLLRHAESLLTRYFGM